MVDYHFFTLANPGGHHMVNVALHIISTLLLFLALFRMTGSVWKSGFVAALFAIHPAHMESVAWVAERKDVLSTVFWMSTMLLYLCSRPSCQADARHAALRAAAARLVAARTVRAASGR
jgi:hypothetical protein